MPSDMPSDARRLVTPVPPEVIPVPLDAAKLPLWRDGLFWLTQALTLFAIAPFALPGYFWGANDARHHVYFLFEYNRLVEDGIWWPRWSPDFAFGFGYPFFNIYAPLSHFLAELLLRFLGFSYTAAVEAIFVLSIVGSAAGMYLFVRAWAGRAAALLAGLTYVYLPYHLFNLYVRANLSESMALLWLPFCLWAVRQSIVQPHVGYRVGHRDGKWAGWAVYRWTVACALSYAGLMLTSNLVVVLFTPLLALYALVLTLVYAVPEGERVSGWLARAGWIVRRGLPGALGLLAGLGLSAIFWIPALLEQQYVRVDQWFDGRYDYRGHFVYLYQLFSPRWDFGVSAIGPDDLVGFQVGIVPLLLVVIGLYLVWRRIPSRLRWEIGTLALGALGGIFLSLTWAAPLWELPLLSGILRSAQFPWRWLSVSTVALSALAGLPLLGLPDDGRNAISLPLTALAATIILSSYPLLRVEISEPAEGPVGLAALMRFQQSSDEMTGSTAWVKEIPEWGPIADEYITMERNGQPVVPVESLVDYTTLQYNCETGFVVDSLARNSISEEVWYCAAQPGRRIIYNHFYYPGWRAYLLDAPSGQPVQELAIVPEQEGTLGRMTVEVPPGEGYVLLRFEDTPPRIIGRIISLATLGLLVAVGLGFLWWSRQEQKRQ